jgi:hypothetical protein
MRTGPPTGRPGRRRKTAAGLGRSSSRRAIAWRRGPPARPRRGRV